MPMSSIGNMSQTFLSNRHNVDLRTRLAQLTDELATGQKSDLTRSLGSDVGRYSQVSRRLSLIDAYQSAANETGQSLNAVQSALERLNSVRSDLSDRLLKADFSTGDTQLEGHSDAARNTFGEMVSALNTRFADRSVFSGNATDTAAVASAEDMLSSIEAAVAGLADIDDVEAAVDDWFDDPAGGFATMGYTGDTGDLAERKVDDGVTIKLDARADNVAITDLLKATAKAIVAAESTAMPQDERVELLRNAGEALLSGAQPLVRLQSLVGSTQARIEDVLVRQETEATQLGEFHNDLVLADPFETASALQELQIQLETHYALTARLSRLSLTEYL